MDSKGGVVMRYMVLAVTVIVLVAAIYMLLSTFKERKKYSHRKANEYCDLGFQRVMQSADPANPVTISGTDTVEYDKGWYHVSVDTSFTDSSLSLYITYSGGCNTSVVTKDRRLFYSFETDSGDTIWDRSF